MTLVKLIHARTDAPGFKFPIHSRADVQRLQAAGFHAYLIGDPAAAIKALTAA